MNPHPAVTQIKDKYSDVAAIRNNCLQLETSLTFASSLLQGVLNSSSSSSASATAYAAAPAAPHFFIFTTVGAELILFPRAAAEATLKIFRWVNSACWAASAGSYACLTEAAIERSLDDTCWIAAGPNSFISQRAGETGETQVKGRRYLTHPHSGPN